MVDFLKLLTPEQIAHSERRSKDLHSRIIGPVYASDERGNRFLKIAHLAARDLGVLCLGGPIQYRLADIDWNYLGERDNPFCIDAGGLNHRGIPGVCISRSDIIRVFTAAKLLGEKLATVDRSEWINGFCCPDEVDLKESRVFHRENAAAKETSEMNVWPKPIEVIGVTGEYMSGKTLFALTIDPSRTLIFDTEKSSGGYAADLGATRIDIPGELMRAKKQDFKPLDVFLYFRQAVKKIEPGKYSVIALDTVSEVESGLADYVSANPAEFGRTAAQYIKMQGLMWGDVKELWKAILSDLASRCQTFVFTSHMTSVWAGDKPIPGKRKPKGKETLMELASLYLHLERKPDATGSIPSKPSATILKTRLSSFIPGPEGIEIVPTLPPRLPEATPAAIRRYMSAPKKPEAYDKSELAPVETMTEDDRLLIRLATAEAERDAAAMSLQPREETSEGAIPHGAGAGAHSGRGGVTLNTEIKISPPRQPPAEEARRILDRQPDPIPPEVKNARTAAETHAQLEQAFGQSENPAPVETASPPVTITGGGPPGAFKPPQPERVVREPDGLPKALLLRGILSEAQGRETFDALAPLFKTLPPIADPEDRDLFLAGLIMRGFELSEHRGQIQRIATWLEKQKKLISPAMHQKIKDAGSLRYQALPPAPAT